MAPVPGLFKAANTPTNNTSVAGGASTSGQITNAGAGEWSPQLVALSTGVIDTDVALQIQAAYIANTGSSTWYAGGFYVDNLLVRPGTPGIITLVSTSASDNNTLYVQVEGVVSVSGVLTYLSRNITLNGTTPVSGTDTWVRIERLTLRVLTTGLIVAATGRISATIGTGTPIAIGAIPAPIPITGGGFTSYYYASGEHEYAVAATQGDQGTYANRLTDPFSGTGTWVRPNSVATMLAMPADMAAGDKFCIYRRETLQPGMSSANPLTSANWLYGTG